MVALAQVAVALCAIVTGSKLGNDKLYMDEEHLRDRNKEGTTHGKGALSKLGMEGECDWMLRDAVANASTFDLYMDLDPKPGERPPLSSGKVGLYSDAYKYVLFLFTDKEGDHNGSLALLPWLCARIRCWAKRGFDVVLRRVSSVEDAMTSLRKFPDRSLHHVVIGGHGNCHSLQLGRDALDTDEKGYWGTTPSFFRTLGSKTLLSASVTFQACSTAQERCGGKKNFFQIAAAHLAGRRVLAAKKGMNAGMFVHEGSPPPTIPPIKIQEDFVPNDFDYKNIWKITVMDLFAHVFLGENFDADTCVTGDRAILRDGSEDVYELAPRGQPLCADLRMEDLPNITHCKTYCASARLHPECSKLVVDGAWVRLSEPRPKLVDDRVNMCGDGEYRKVCEVGAVDPDFSPDFSSEDDLGY